MVRQQIHRFNHYWHFWGTKLHASCDDASDEFNVYRGCAFYCEVGLQLEKIQCLVIIPFIVSEIYRYKLKGNDQSS